MQAKQRNKKLTFGKGCNNVEEEDYAWEGCKQSKRRIFMERGVTNSKQHNIMHWMLQKQIMHVRNITKYKKLLHWMGVAE